MIEFAALLSAIVYIFVIIDPFASLPVFMALTKRLSELEMHNAAKNAVLIAGALALVFIICGDVVLALMRIDIGSFKIAGGIVLGLLGLETVLGLKLAKNHLDEKNAIATLIATPMLTGPGLITTLIIMVKEQGLEIPLFATAFALLLSWLVLDNASKLRRMFGHQAIEVLAKLFGLFLVAIGISFIKSGIGF